MRTALPIALLIATAALAVAPTGAPASVATTTTAAAPETSPAEDPLAGAREAFDAGKLPAAAALLDALLATSPYDAAALKLRAQVAEGLAMRMDATLFYRRAAAIAPTDTGVRLGLVQSLVAMGLREQALRELDQALARLPLEHSLWSQRGKIELEMGQFRQAEEAYQTALHLGSTDEEDVENLSVALQGQGRTQEALTTLDELLERAPHRVTARAGRCILLGRTGKTAEALRCLEEFENDFPAENEAPFQRGIILEHEGRPALAREAYAHAVVLGRRGHDVYAALARVNAALGRVTEAEQYRAVAEGRSGARMPAPGARMAPGTGMAPGAQQEPGAALEPGPEQTPRPGQPLEARPGQTPGPGPRPAEAPGVGDVPRFIDASDAWGLRFLHEAGLPVLWIPQELGSGVAVFDFDGDGFDDIYLVNGKSAPPPGADGTIDWRGFFAGLTGTTGGNRLFRNLGDRHVADVTVPARVAGGTYGLGVAVADVNQDGYPDIVVTGLPRNLLLINDGDGTFHETAQAAGLTSSGFDTGVCAGDLDGSGYPDLYMTAYARFGPDDLRHYPTPQPSMVGTEFLDTLRPAIYPPRPSRLFHNLGDGTFADVTAARQATNNERGQGKGLGCAMFDHDGDGKLDIYIANDTTPNSLYRNVGPGPMVNVAPREWVDDGRSCMGVAVGDYDGDGALDLYITNWVGDSQALYRHTAKSYIDTTVAAGLAFPPFAFCGWGALFVDLDLDGHPDLVQINGDVTAGSYPPGHYLTEPRPLLPQPWQVFLNRADGTFSDVSATALERIAPACGRGLAAGDLDHDGQVELVAQVHNGKAVLLADQVRHVGHWLLLDLAGTHGTRDALGATVELACGRLRQTAAVLSGGGYLSQSSRLLHFGIGAWTGTVEARVRWAGAARRERFGPLRPDRITRLVQGTGRLESATR